MATASKGGTGRRPIRYLFAGWAAYWAALAVAVFAVPARIAWHASRLGPDRGELSAGFTDALFRLTIKEDGRSVFTASASITAIVLWVAIPPIVMWLAWLWTRPEPDAGHAAAGRRETLSLLESNSALDSIAPIAAPRGGHKSPIPVPRRSTSDDRTT